MVSRNLKVLNDKICYIILQTHKKVSKPSLPGGAPLTPLDETILPTAVVNPPSYGTTHAVSNKYSFTSFHSSYELLRERKQACFFWTSLLKQYSATMLSYL